MARDYSLSTVVPPPNVAIGYVETKDGRQPVFTSEEWRLSWFERVGVALFGETGEEDITLDIPAGNYIGTLAGDPSKGLLVSGTPAPGYAVTVSLSRNIITDGAKLDGIEAGATADQTAAEIRTLVEAATDSNVFTDADQTKLNGIATGATANATDAQLRDRTTHTGAQAISTVTGLQTALDGKAASSHTHIIGDVTGLQTALDSKVTKDATITAAEEAHTEPADFAAVKTALDALGAIINEIRASMNA